MSSGPEGAKFSPSLALTFRYNPLSLPEGTDGNKLSLNFWDGSKWVASESTLNIAERTVADKVSHFSKYALLVEVPLPPAKLAISDFRISPAEVNPGEATTVQIVVSNTGGGQGEFALL